MTNKRSVCILAPVHHYSDIRVFQKEAKTLAAANYTVQLIARSDKSEISDGVSIIATPQYKNRLQRFMLMPWLFAKALSTKSDIIHIHNPDTLLVGLLLKIVGKAVIYDTHEDFAERLKMRKWIPHGIRSALAYVISKLEQICAAIFDASIATQPEVAQRLGMKSIVIENAPISRGVLIERAYAHSAMRRKDQFFRVVYVGGISETRGLYTMIDALALLNETTLTRMWLIGPIADPQELLTAQARAGWEYVDYLGSLPQDEAFSYMIVADVGLITIRDVGDHYRTSPNKIFEYQRFGIPYIASFSQRWIKQLGSLRSGLFVDPDNPVEIADALKWLHNHPEEARQMGERGMEYIINTYNWEKEAEKLLDVYARV